MRLAPSQVQRFYSIWKPLLLYVNEKYKLVAGMDFDDPRCIPDIHRLRQALWDDDSVLDMFALENSVGLTKEDLALVKSWRHRVVGKFFILRQLKKHAIFMTDDKVYAVLALESFFEELVPQIPAYVEAILLPFEGQIIYDTLLAPYPIVFGRGIQANMKEEYMAAKKRGKIIETLNTELPAVGVSQDCAVVA
jgi:hypothetical protein